MNTKAVLIIKAYCGHGDSIAAIGAVVVWVHERLPEGWLVANGQYLRVEDYPELFSAIGVRYSAPPFIYENMPQGLFTRLLRLEPKKRRFPNPLYRGPGMFAVPDLRNHLTLQRPVP